MCYFFSIRRILLFRNSTIELYLVMLGQNGELIGADLVGRVAVEHDTVSADHHGRDTLCRHQKANHVIANQRRRHFLVHELVGSQS